MNRRIVMTNPSLLFYEISLSNTDNNCYYLRDNQSKRYTK